MDCLHTRLAVLASRILTPVGHLPAVEVGYHVRDGLQVHGHREFNYLGEGAAIIVDARPVSVKGQCISYQLQWAYVGEEPIYAATGYYYLLNTHEAA